MKCGRLVGKSAVAVLVVLMVLLSFQQISRLRFEHLERNLLEVNGIHGGWNAAHCRNGDAELVYAVMITGKSPDRELLARRALDDFWRQTHPSKALIVLTENAFQLPTNGDPCVLQMVVRPAAGTRLGQLRNYALAAVPAGAVWVQWDDDDGHHEDLMAGQLRCLKENAANGSLLRAQIRWVGRSIKPVSSAPPLSSRFCGFAPAVSHRFGSGFDCGCLPPRGVPSGNVNGLMFSRKLFRHVCLLPLLSSVLRRPTVAGRLLLAACWTLPIDNRRSAATGGRF
ncbi:unnamed protein product [Phaeothamnion confervicola]